MRNTKRQKNSQVKNKAAGAQKGQRGVVKGSQQIRIIGGKWGSRRLQFPAALGLRPTIDRVRETLFNWLAFELAGKSVLDAFSGSGALGFEAASRGARKVVMLEKQASVVSTLVGHAHTLEAGEQLEIYAADTLKFFAEPAKEAFDIILLDPPFRQDLLQQSIDLIEENGWLANDALVYMEYESELTDLALPSHWQCHREKQAGQSIYALYKIEKG